MKTAHVIIGSAFGDEGKGLFTDYLASRSPAKTCVVRFNGGAQAGHTVELPDGRRHIFSHFGSGSFAGTPTFLSSHFVCNPIIFLREKAELASLHIAPAVYADTACPVTTPYDIMINQIVEQTRGHRRHGSVGVGFGETLERHEHEAFALRLGDLGNADRLRCHLDRIRLQWAPARLAALDIQSLPPEWSERMNAEAIRERFIEDAAQFLACLSPVSASHLAHWDHFIFEGAQGLLLDQTRGWFPHVTRSHTGIRNVLPLAEALGIRDLDVHYLTRPYTTRHGAGPLPHELPHPPYAGIVDRTNRPNAYQGTLRFAWLDADLFTDTVRRDMSDAAGRIHIRPHLGMSCLDQIDGDACYVANGVLHRTDTMSLPILLGERIAAHSQLASFGPTRKTVEAVKTARRRSIAGRRNEFFKRLDIVQNNVVTVEA
ncbi:MAG: adenylosuccinate synthetase [Bdellovibrionales bacterium]